MKKSCYDSAIGNGNYWTDQSIVRVEVSSSGDLGYTTVSYETVSNADGETNITKGGITFIWKKPAGGHGK